MTSIDTILAAAKTYAQDAVMTAIEERGYAPKGFFVLASREEVIEQVADMANITDVSKAQEKAIISAFKAAYTVAREEG